MDTLKQNLWRVLAISMAGVFIAAILVYVLPVLQGVFSIKNETTVLQARVEQAINWEDRLNQIEEERASIEQFFSGLEIELHNQNFMSTVVERFYDEARKSNVSVLQIRPLEKKSTGAIFEHPFELRIEGTYHRIGGMVNRLEKLGFWIRPERIQIVVTESEGEKLQALLQVRVFQIAPNPDQSAGE
jgi:Tfp pilus assembly protein PilO